MFCNHLVLVFCLWLLGIFMPQSLLGSAGGIVFKSSSVYPSVHVCVRAFIWDVVSMISEVYIDGFSPDFCQECIVRQR